MDSDAGSTRAKFVGANYETRTSPTMTETYSPFPGLANDVEGVIIL